MLTTKMILKLFPGRNIMYNIFSAIKEKYPYLPDSFINYRLTSLDSKMKDFVYYPSLKAAMWCDFEDRYKSPINYYKGE